MGAIVVVVAQTGDLAGEISDLAVLAALLVGGDGLKDDERAVVLAQLQLVL